METNKLEKLDGNKHCLYKMYIDDFFQLLINFFWYDRFWLKPASMLWGRLYNVFYRITISYKTTIIFK